MVGYIEGNGNLEDVVDMENIKAKMVLITKVTGKMINKLDTAK